MVEEEPVDLDDRGAPVISPSKVILVFGTSSYDSG
jgi:hypothetical protein